MSLLTYTSHSHAHSPISLISLHSYYRLSAEHNFEVTYLKMYAKIVAVGSLSSRKHLMLLSYEYGSFPGEHAVAKWVMNPPKHTHGTYMHSFSICIKFSAGSIFVNAPWVRSFAITQDVLIPRSSLVAIQLEHTLKCKQPRWEIWTDWSVAQKSEQNTLLYHTLATWGIPCCYLELVYSQHPAIARSKSFSDPNAFSPHTRPPFRVTDAILPSMPVDQRDFDGDRGQKMMHWPASIGRQTDRHKYSDKLEAAWIKNSKRYKDIWSNYYP